MRVRAIHQMLAGFGPGDAIGNHARHIQRCLRAWGYESRMFAEHRDPATAEICEDYRAYLGDPRNMVILHYAIDSKVTEHVQGLPDRVVVYYHNITPTHFLHGINRRMEMELERGRAKLPTLRNAPFVLAASEYNAAELAELGFAPATVIPYFLDLEALQAPITSPAGREVLDQFGQEGWVNLLFVGRIVPNKRQEDLLRLMAYYQRWVRPKSRLLLVGSDVNAELYSVQLDMMAERLGLQEVYLCGRALHDQLAAYYRVASVFTSMSEHEGFCVPVIEAMTLGVPVLAHAAAAVPRTMGDAGVLTHQKRYDVLGEMIELLVTDGDLRQRVIAAQRARAQAFTPAVVEAQLKQFIEQIALT